MVCFEYEKNVCIAYTLQNKEKSQCIYLLKKKVSVINFIELKENQCSFPMVLNTIIKDGPKAGWGVRTMVP